MEVMTHLRQHLSWKDLHDGLIVGVFTGALIFILAIVCKIVDVTG